MAAGNGLRLYVGWLLSLHFVAGEDEMLDTSEFQLRDVVFG